MLQSPAPALIKMEPPLSGPSMKAKSLMVPSCMLNSRSGPAAGATQRQEVDHHLLLLFSIVHFQFLTVGGRLSWKLHVTSVKYKVVAVINIYHYSKVSFNIAKYCYVVCTHVVLYLLFSIFRKYYCICINIYTHTYVFFKTEHKYIFITVEV